LWAADTTTQTWDGLTPVGTDSTLHGGTSLLRDPYGDVALQDGPYSHDWVLGDGRNSTATADTAGAVTDLVDYGTFGDARYESTGWASVTGNDGQPGDPTLGIDQYYARNYDSSLGSWLSPDTWRGLLTAPQTLNRYAYVTNNPTTFSDHLGHIPGPALSDGGSWTSVGAAKAAAQASAAKNYSQPANNPAPSAEGGRQGTRVPTGKPSMSNDRSPRHTAQRHQPAGGAECLTYQGSEVLDCLLGYPDRQVQAGVQRIQEWIVDNLSAGASVSFCLVICGEFGATNSGFIGGLGVGPDVGFGLSGGVGAFGEGEPSMNLVCSGAVGPVGGYVEVGQGADNFPVGSGWSSGLEAGCALMARTEWNLW
jgi:RHS repeat-associated protein